MFPQKVLEVNRESKSQPRYNKNIQRVAEYKDYNKVGQVNEWTDTENKDEEETQM